MTDELFQFVVGAFFVVLVVVPVTCLLLYLKHGREADIRHIQQTALVCDQKGGVYSPVVGCIKKEALIAL